MVVLYPVWTKLDTEFHNVWGGTREEADKKMRQFFASPFFHGTGRGIPVIDGAREVLKKHAHRLDLHVVTSRQNILEDHTREWVEANYPGIFTKLHFGNHHSTEGEVRSKPDLCRAIDAVMIIDDNVRYATQCAEAGIRTCLYGKRVLDDQTEECPSDHVMVCQIAGQIIHRHRGSRKSSSCSRKRAF